MSSAVLSESPAKSRARSLFTSVSGFSSKGGLHVLAALSAVGRVLRAVPAAVSEGKALRDSLSIVRKSGSGFSAPDDALIQE